MILNKETKRELREGMLLRFDCGHTYRVRSVYRGTSRNGGINLTVIDTADGRAIYYTPSSGFYGAEMIMEEVNS